MPKSDKKFRVRVIEIERRRKGTVTYLGASTLLSESEWKAAAVADYKPKKRAEQKIKRKGSITLELEPTADIVAEIAKERKNQIIIGFAAETENVMANARKKLAAKSLDAIVVNDVSKPGIGFDSDRNAVTIITAEGASQVPEAGKPQVAKSILQFVVSMKHSRAVSHSIR